MRKNEAVRAQPTRGLTRQEDGTFKEAVWQVAVIQGRTRLEW